MKKFIFAALFALPIIVHPPAEAASNDPAGIVCRSTGVADAGYHLYVPGKRDVAKLSEITFAGFGKQLNLKCQELAILAIEGMTQNTLLCVNTQRLGSATIVRLYENRRMGVLRASVRARVVAPGSTEKEVQFGSLACERTEN